MRRLGLAILLALAACAAAPEARATRAEPPPRVLGPEVAPLALRALKPVVSPWRIDGLTADASTLTVRLCLDADCHGLQLSDPQPTCPAQAVGPFCPTWPDALSPPLRLLVGNALAAAFTRSPWHEPERDPPPEPVADGAAAQPAAERAAADAGGQPPADSTARPAPRPRWLIWLLAIAIVLGPAVFGFGLGHLWRRRRPGPAPPLVAWGIAPLLLAGTLVLATRSPSWPLHDLLWAALTGGVAFALAARARAAPLDRRGLLAGVVALGLSLGLAECGARLLAPPLRPAPPPERARLTFDHAEFEWGCAALYPQLWPDVFVDLRPRAEEPAGPRILHLGDSMVAATEVDLSERFTERLNMGMPGSRQLNLGVSGTGSDHHLALLRAQLDRARPDLVVYHLFAGNDLVEIDRGYTCCGGGPLLDEDLAGRCAQPRWRYPFLLLLARQPAPWFVRVLASESRFALLALRGLERVSAALDPDLGLDAEGTFGDEASWARLDAILRELSSVAEAGGVPLIVSVLPYRQALAGGEHPAEAARLEMLRRVRAAGLEALDPTPMLREAALAEGADALFTADVPWDVHFSARGHQLYGDWLAVRLPGLLETPASGVH